MISAIGRVLPVDAAFIGRTTRFALVGISSTALYFVIARALSEAVAVEAASFVAQGLTIVYSYFMQKWVTFGVSGRHRRYGPRFVVATVALVSAAQALVWSLDEAGLSHTTTLLANSVFYPVASFAVHGFWTFARPETSRRRRA